MSERQIAGLARSLDRGAQERIVTAAQFNAKDLARWNDDTLALAFKSLNASDRAELLARSGANQAAFERMSERQIAGLARSLDRGAQERIAANAQFNAKDMARWNDDTLALAFKSLNASDRGNVLARSGVDEAMFQRSTVVQKAAFADFLGAKAFERSVLHERNFNRLSAAQLQAVWSDLGRGGQEAALLRAGFEADMARGSAIQRQENFERYMKERQSRD
jgi:hypothetical protein